MDPSFFGLSDHPFNDHGNDSDEELLAEAHASLITELRAGLRAPHGITLLVGESGTGKTALAKSLVGRLSDTATAAYLPTTGPGLRHLLSEAIEQLGGEVAPAAEEGALIEALRSIARARAEHSRTTVIIVDDAHELPAKTLERLSKVFGDDPADPSMLHIVLVGRQELLDRMNAASDRSILKHLIQVCRMDPIGPEDSLRYIADRLRKVGGVAESIFSHEALEKIVRVSKGVPHRIDQICTAALAEAQARGETEVGVDLVRSAEMETPEEDAGASSEHGFVLGEPSSPGASARPAAPAAKRSGLGRFKDVYENRRRLALWGAGLIVTVVGLAAALTSTPGDNVADNVANLASTKHGATLAGKSDADARQMRAAAKAEGKMQATAGSAAVAARPLTEPDSAPKLVVNRGTETPSPVETAQAKPQALVPPPGRPTEFPSPGAAKAVAPAQVASTAGQPAAATPVRPSPSGVAATAPPAQVAPSTPAAVASAGAASGASAQAAAATPRGGIQIKPAPGPAPVARIAKPSTTPSAAATTAAAANKQGSYGAVVSTSSAAGAAKQQAAEKKAVVGAAASINAVREGLRGKYSVQIGSFSTKTNAEAALDKLAKSFPDDGHISQVTTGGKTMFRVLSGAFGSKKEAAQRELALKNSGFPTFVRVNR